MKGCTNEEMVMKYGRALTIRQQEHVSSIICILCSYNHKIWSDRDSDQSHLLTGNCMVL